MLHRLCRIAVLGAALAAASVSHAQLIIPGGSSSGSGATPGGSSGQLQFNNAGAFGAGPGPRDDTNRALTISGATVTSSKPLLDLSLTRMLAGRVFRAETECDRYSRARTVRCCWTYQVGGVSIQHQQDRFADGCWFYSAYSSGLWSVSDLGGIFPRRIPDVVLKRDAANTPALRNGANAQTFNIYNTYTDASNYERGFIGFVQRILHFRRKRQEQEPPATCIIYPFSKQFAVFRYWWCANWADKRWQFVGIYRQHSRHWVEWDVQAENVYVARGSVYATDLLVNTNGGVIAIGSVGDVKMYRDAAKCSPCVTGRVRSSSTCTNVYGCVEL